MSIVPLWAAINAQPPAQLPMLSQRDVHDHFLAHLTNKSTKHAPACGLPVRSGAEHHIHPTCTNRELSGRPDTPHRPDPRRSRLRRASRRRAADASSGKLWQWMAPRSTGLSSSAAVATHSGCYMNIDEINTVWSGGRAGGGPGRPSLAAHLTAVGASAPLDVSGALSQTAAQRGKIGTFARSRFLPPGAVLEERSRRPGCGRRGLWHRAFCASRARTERTKSARHTCRPEPSGGG